MVRIGISRSCRRLAVSDAKQHDADAGTLEIGFLAKGNITDSHRLRVGERFMDPRLELEEVQDRVGAPVGSVARPVGLVLGAAVAAAAKAFVPASDSAALTDFAVRWIEPNISPGLGY